MAVVPHDPSRMAVIIGICYLEREISPQYGRLRGPVIAAKAMKTLLLKHFNFLEENVVLMVDERDYPHRLKPSKINMKRELRQLTRDAQHGDFRFLYYAGHVASIRCNEHTEECGLDQAIVAADCNGTEKGQGRNLLKDNWLRKHLVDSLPEGVRLRAIFDGCYSEGLMDLIHYKCNLTHVQMDSGPLHSFRTKSPTNSPSRKPSLPLMSLVGETMSAAVDAAESTSSKENLPAIFANVRSSGSSGLSPTHGRSGSGSQDDPLRFYPLATVFTNSRENFAMFDFHARHLDSEFPRCTSPESMGSQTERCTGRCAVGGVTGKDVVSFSVCDNYQQSWEDGKGNSMTQLMIEQLAENPQATYVQLMKHIVPCHEQRVHNVRERLRRHGKLVLPTYQDPQLGSMIPLNVHEPFIFFD